MQLDIAGGPGREGVGHARGDDLRAQDFELHDLLLVGSDPNLERLQGWPLAMRKDTHRVAIVARSLCREDGALFSWLIDGPVDGDEHREWRLFVTSQPVSVWDGIRGAGGRR